MYLLGPKGSGKSTVGQTMSSRVNIKLVDFNNFVRMNGLRGKDDDIIVSQFIQYLAKEKALRVLIEHFPQNLQQAKYFTRNGTVPSNVFTLDCSMDKCQERMYLLGEGNPGYVKSAILSKKIKKYYQDMAVLAPYFQENSNLSEINSDQLLSCVMEDIYKIIEPTVIHVRPGANSGELPTEIVENLSNNHGYINLDIKKCIVGEAERGTDIGK